MYFKIVLALASALAYIHRVQIKKKVPLIFFAVTFTNIDGFS